MRLRAVRCSTGTRKIGAASFVTFTWNLDATRAIVKPKTHRHRRVPLPYRASQIGMYVGTRHGCRTRFGKHSRNCLNPCEHNMER